MRRARGLGAPSALRGRGGRHSSAAGACRASLALPLALVCTWAAAQGRLRLWDGLAAYPRTLALPVFLLLGGLGMLAAAAAGGDPALWWLSWSALCVAHAARLLLAPAWLRWGAYTPARDAVVDALFMVALPLLAGAAPVLLAAARRGEQQ